MRHKLTIADRVKGAKKALKSKKINPGFRRYLEKFLKDHDR
jgi:hypothetical protein